MKSFNMKFFLENNGESWPDCTMAELEDAVLEMLADKEQFVVLSPAEPVGPLRIRFMQAAQYPQGVKVEYSLRFGGQWRIYFRHYAKGGEVLRLFEDFYSGGGTPDFDEYELDERVYPD